MPTKFNLSSNHWILLSIVLLVSSSYPYNQLKTQKSSIDSRAKESIKKAVTDEKNTRTLDEDLRKAKTTQSTNSTPLNIKFQEFIYGVKSVGMRYGVDITATTARDGSMAGTSRELSAVAVPLATAPSIKVLTIELRGKAKNVDDLRKFLDFLSIQQIAIANITLNRDVFVVTLDMYGI